MSHDLSVSTGSDEVNPGKGQEYTLEEHTPEHTLEETCMKHANPKRKAWKWNPARS